MRHRTWPIALLLTATLVAPGAALAETAVGVVTTVLGQVTVVRATLPEPAPLRFKDDIFVHDRIVTGSDSLARVLLGGKALLTVREQSQLVVNEVPGVTTIDMGSGRFMMAVVKGRMKPGESIEIKTPNAVAGIRGTVFVVEVTGTGNRVKTNLTVLRGLVEVTPLDLASKRPVGPSVNVGALQSVGISGMAAPQLRAITPDAAQRLGNDYKVKRVDPAQVKAVLPEAHVEQMAKDAAAMVAPAERQDRARNDGDQARGKDNGVSTKRDDGGKGDRDTTPVPAATGLLDGRGRLWSKDRDSDDRQSGGSGPSGGPAVAPPALSPAAAPTLGTLPDQPKTTSAPVSTGVGGSVSLPAAPTLPAATGLPTGGSFPATGGFSSSGPLVKIADDIKGPAILLPTQRPSFDNIGRDVEKGHRGKR